MAYLTDQADIEHVALQDPEAQTLFVEREVINYRQRSEGVTWKDIEAFRMTLESHLRKVQIESLLRKVQIAEPISDILPDRPSKPKRISTPAIKTTA